MSESEIPSQPEDGEPPSKTKRYRRVIEPAVPVLRSWNHPDSHQIDTDYEHLRGRLVVSELSTRTNAVIDAYSQDPTTHTGENVLRDIVRSHQGMGDVELCRAIFPRDDEDAPNDQPRVGYTMNIRFPETSALIDRYSWFLHGQVIYDRQGNVVANTQEIRDHLFQAFPLDSDRQEASQPQNTRRFPKLLERLRLIVKTT